MEKGGALKPSLKDKNRNTDLNQLILGNQILINLHQLKKKTRNGCWNVWTILKASKLTQLARKIEEMKKDGPGQTGSGS